MTARFELSRSMFDDITRCRIDKLSWREIARQYGVSASTLHRAYLRMSHLIYAGAFR